MVQCKSSTRFCVKTTWLLHLPQPLLSLHLPSLPPSLPSLYYNVNPKYGSLLLFSLNHLNKLLTFSLIQLRHKCIPTPRLYLSILLYSGCCSCLEFSLIDNILSYRCNLLSRNGTTFLLFKAKIKERFVVTWRRWETTQLYN
jgi:hypothetical protein